MIDHLTRNETIAKLASQQRPYLEITSAKKLLNKNKNTSTFGEE